jgi:AAA+ ATPase superfamily predicted ATPase
MNPFTPSFGSSPVLLAGRSSIIRNIIGGLQNGPGDPNRVVIFSGPRGSGKTVLLSEIVNQAESVGWITASVTAMAGMLDDILDQTKENGRELLAKKERSHIIGVNAAGFGFTRKVDDEEEVGWRMQMTRLIKELNHNGIGLLLTVDEAVVTVQELRVLVATFQHFVREKRDVALFMAGLPHNISAMLNDGLLSFLRRAFTYKLDLVDLAEVRLTMKKTIELSDRDIEKKALDLATDRTGGFPFLIQLIGYHIWNQSPNKKRISLNDVESGIEVAKLDMYSMIMETTVKGLSKIDRQFLLAMTEDEDESAISDIAKRLGVTTNYAGQYRLRLIEQGVIVPVDKGTVTFSLPMLKEFLIERS